MAIDTEQWFRIQQGKLSILSENDIPDGYKTRTLRRFKTEKNMTELLFKHPDVLENDLMVVRADPEGEGGADITGITSEGQIIIVETKRVTVNTTTLGQAMGYALEADKWPKKGCFLSKMKYWQVQKPEELCRRIDSGSKSKAFPVVSVVGNNVTASLLEMAKYMAENRFTGKSIDVRVITVGYWEAEKEGEGYICKRLHKMDEEPPVDWDAWEHGDLARYREWLDTDWYEPPLFVVGYADDGQIIVMNTKRDNKGKHVPIGDAETVPFLSNYKRVR